MDIEVIIDKLNNILFNNYPKNLAMEEREKLFDKKDELRGGSFSERAKGKLYDVLVEIENILKNGKRDELEFKSLIDKFRDMSTKKHRNEVIEHILSSQIQGM